MARHRRNTDRARTARTTLAPLGLASAAVLTAAPFASAAPAQPARAATSPPCDDTADVCVDLSAHRAWLTHGGRSTSAAMPITSGSTEDPTPTGTFSVQRKERHHVSKESGRDTPMPYSVFFDDEGRAFHTGNTGRASNGCIHLEQDDARDVFAALEPGDEVEIVR
jgi:L,D-transpeptidase catalytic domain